MLILPNSIARLFILSVVCALPIAIITLPQLGSSPAIAVFTSGELAIEKAIFFASVSVLSLTLIIFLCFARAVEKIETISFVLVSPSQLIALNVDSIFLFKNFLRISLDKLASVKT